MTQGAAERLAIIIDAVERAAAGVIDDAEAQAKQHLQQARARADRIAEERIRAITELTDGLIEQAEEVKRQADELIAASRSGERGARWCRRWGGGAVRRGKWGGCRFRHAQRG